MGHRTTFAGGPWPNVSMDTCTTNITSSEICCSFFRFVMVQINSFGSFPFMVLISRLAFSPYQKRGPPKKVRCLKIMMIELEIALVMVIALNSYCLRALFALNTDV